MKRATDGDEGFNNIRVWLLSKLAERGIGSVEAFCNRTGSRINPVAVWRWFSDDYRPYPSKMQIVCETLSRLPIKLPNGDEYLEDVPWSEGLAQYTPRPRAWEAHYLNAPSGRKKENRGQAKTGYKQQLTKNLPKEINKQMGNKKKRGRLP